MAYSYITSSTTYDLRRDFSMLHLMAATCGMLGLGLFVAMSPRYRDGTANRPSGAWRYVLTVVPAVAWYLVAALGRRRIWSEEPRYRVR